MEELRAAKKVLASGMKRSLEYKEAQKLMDEHGDKLGVYSLHCCSLKVLLEKLFRD